jgi:hypothetical protein
MRDEERHKVIHRSKRVTNAWRSASIVKQRVEILARDCLSSPGIELHDLRLPGEVGSAA